MTYAGTQKLPEGWTVKNAVDKAKDYTKEVVEELTKENAIPTIITIGNEVDWNFLGITEEGGWNGWVAMGDISAYLKDNGIKNAVSIAAPKEASAIKEIIDGKLKWTKADYDYIGVNLYPDDNTNTYVKELRDAVEECSEKKQLIVSSVKYARVNEEDTVNVYTQAENIYNLLSATIDKNNAGGIIYDDAVYTGSWNSLVDDDGDAQISLAIFAYAQGKQTDTSRDPYKYGDDTGLKSQKVTIRKVSKMTDSTASYEAATKRVVVYAVPKKQTLQKVRKSGKTVRVNVKKDTKATGYQVITSTNKKFTRNKKSAVSKKNRNLNIILRQKSKETYYVKARSYIKIGKKYYYSPWSKVKKVTLR